MGRKYSMMVDCAITLAGLISIRLANSFVLLFVGRLLTGYSDGSNKTSILPYTSEISQPQIRKFTGSLFNLFYSCGFAFMFMLGALFDWRTVVSITTVWPCLIFILLAFCPKSPTWLLINGRETDAYNAMKKLRGDESIVKIELLRVRQNLEKQEGQNRSEGQNASLYKRIKRLLFRGTFLRPFLVIIVIYGIGFCWSGPLFLSFYMVYIVKKSDLPLNPYWISSGLCFYRLFLSILSSIIAPFMPRRKLFLCTSFILATGGLLIGTIGYLSELTWYIETQDSYPALRWLPILSIGVLYTGRL